MKKSAVLLTIFEGANFVSYWGNGEKARKTAKNALDKKIAGIFVCSWTVLPGSLRIVVVASSKLK